MSASQKEQRPQSPAIELKSASFTLPVLKLLGTDLTAIAEQLTVTVGRAPEFFRNTPVVMDLSPLTDKSKPIDLVGLLKICRDQGLVPIGVRGGSKAHHRSAEAAGMAILADPAPHSKTDAPTTSRAQPKPEPEPEPRRQQPAPTTSQNATRVITQPVRSGQRVHVEGGDLIVTAQVSHGAEIIADGNIHVYGRLFGRALAGAKGDTNSRIFCSDLQAELIAIAGHYQVSEKLDDSVRGMPVQAFLENLSLVIRPL